jgi:hypothetical protein
MNIGLLRILNAVNHISRALSLNHFGPAIHLIGSLLFHQRELEPPSKTQSRDFLKFSGAASDCLAKSGSCDRKNHPGLQKYYRLEECNRKA